MKKVHFHSLDAFGKNIFDVASYLVFKEPKL
jgi:hypothetical protein